MVYIPGKDNVVADALSRWAYPASKAFADSSIHGSPEDEKRMMEFIEQERREERECRVLYVEDAMRELAQVAQARVEAIKRYPMQEWEDFGLKNWRWLFAKSRCSKPRSTK